MRASDRVVSLIDLLPSFFLSFNFISLHNFIFFSLRSLPKVSSQFDQDNIGPEKTIDTFYIKWNLSYMTGWSWTKSWTLLCDFLAKWWWIYFRKCVFIRFVDTNTFLMYQKNYWLSKILFFLFALIWIIIFFFRNTTHGLRYYLNLSIRKFKFNSSFHSLNIFQRWKNHWISSILFFSDFKEHVQFLFSHT